MKFYVSQQAGESQLADGRALVRGEFIEINREDARDPHNERIIGSGALLPTTPTGQKLAEQASDNSNEGDES